MTAFKGMVKDAVQTAVQFYLPGFAQEVLTQRSTIVPRSAGMGSKFLPSNVTMETLMKTTDALGHAKTSTDGAVLLPTLHVLPHAEMV